MMEFFKLDSMEKARFAIGLVCLFVIALINLKMLLIHNESLLAMLAATLLIRIVESVRQHGIKPLLQAFKGFFVGIVFLIATVAIQMNFGLAVLGGGDIKLFMVLGMLIGFNLCFLTSLIALFAALSFSYFSSITVFPLAPFIFISYCIVASAHFFNMGRKEKQASAFMDAI